jgi:hypothetical protein
LREKGSKERVRELCKALSDDWPKYESAMNNHLDAWVRDNNMQVGLSNGGYRCDSGWGRVCLSC